MRSSTEEGAETVVDGVPTSRLKRTLLWHKLGSKASSRIDTAGKQQNLVLGSFAEVELSV